MTDEEYAAIPAVNWSTLKHIETSPLMYRWRLANPEPRKPSYLIGAAAHCAILEPEKFDARYQVFEGRRAGKAWDEWQAERPNVESLKPDEMETVRRMAAAVLGHRVAAGLLRGGRSEAVVTWTDDATGLACKGRLDYLRPDFVLDLKTTRDPAPRRYQRDAFGYGAVGQLALYHDGAFTARLLTRPERPYIVAVQNTEPYDVAVYQLDGDALDAGRAQYQRLLRRLVDCHAADFWPGVAPDLQTLSPPAWASAATIESEEEF